MVKKKVKKKATTDAGIAEEDAAGEGTNADAEEEEVEEEEDADTGPVAASPGAETAADPASAAPADPEPADAAVSSTVDAVGEELHSLLAQLKEAEKEIFESKDDE